MFGTVVVKLVNEITTNTTNTTQKHCYQKDILLNISNSHIKLSVSLKFKYHKDACESFISESFLESVHVNLNKLIHSYESDFTYDREFANH